MFNIVYAALPGLYHNTDKCRTKKWSAVAYFGAGGLWFESRREVFIQFSYLTPTGNGRAEGTSPVGGTSSLNVNKAAEQGEIIEIA